MEGEQSRTARSRPRGWGRFQFGYAGWDFAGDIAGTSGGQIGSEGRDAAISASEVSEKTSSNTRWPFSHTRYILQGGCSAHDLLPSVHTLSVIGPSTASMISRNVTVSALRAS